jgi:PAS domain-containing protein
MVGRCRQMLSSSDTGSWWTTAPTPCVHERGRIVYVNAAGVRWIGAQSSAELVGHPITEFVHSDSVPAMLARIASLRHEGGRRRPILLKHQPPVCRSQVVVFVVARPVPAELDLGIDGDPYPVRPVRVPDRAVAVPHSNSP